MIIVFCALGASATPAHAQSPVFSRDVAPIVFEACTPCHRQGGPGPFSLASYQEVRQRATQIVQVTRSRFMPPWKVEPAIGHFEGQRPLTEAEIATVAAWAAGGTPEGNPGETPALPAFPDGWLLGTPDLIVTPSEPFVLQAEPTDSFRIFAIPIPVSKRTYVRGIEFHPGNARVVHHANIRVDRTPTSRTLDEHDPLPGYDGLMPRTASTPMATSWAGRLDKWRRSSDPTLRGRWSRAAISWCNCTCSPRVRSRRCSR